MTVEGIGTARTFLFVPGCRPDRFARAVDSGADVVVLDLEDAVAPEQKTEARECVRQFLSASDAACACLAVRINATSTADSAIDVEALADTGRPIPVVVPKAEDPGVLARLGENLPAESRLIALIETARGVLAADQIAAVPSVARLAIGHLDLCLEIGLDPADDAGLWPMRSALVLASAANGLPAPIDGVTTEFRDSAKVELDVTRARRTGFGAKLCIHPDQVSAASSAFTPEQAELRWAQHVVSTLSESDLGQVDGQMVDRPVYLRAKAIVASATSGGAPTRNQRLTGKASDKGER